MQTIDDIIFNARVYRRATNLTLLLYEQNGVSVAINLPDANLMPFVQVFHRMGQCQNHININLRKIFTLFAYDENMQNWLVNNINIPHNLQEIKIFCNVADRLYVNAWIRRFTHRFRHATIEIINCDTLNYKLLLFGVDHLKRLQSDFRPRPRLRRQCRRNYKSICRALANHFWQESLN